MKSRWLWILGGLAVLVFVLRRRAAAGGGQRSLSAVTNLAEDPSSQAYKDLALRKLLEQRELPIKEAARVIEQNDLVKKTGLESTDLYRFLLNIPNKAGELLTGAGGDPAGNLPPPSPVFSFEPFPDRNQYGGPLIPPSPQPPAPPPTPSPGPYSPGVPPGGSNDGGWGQKIIDFFKKWF